uniref:ISXO2-like transposase domain-containing protein n=1 Tax=Octopus bimaculoides TaxID=37653 RepID=A0A0L8FWV1_OCTBM
MGAVQQSTIILSTIGQRSDIWGKVQVDYIDPERMKDGFVWRCRNCKKNISIRTKAFMEMSKLSIQQIFHIVFNFMSEAPISTAVLYTGVDNKAAIQWYEFCREVCLGKMRDKAPLGGPGQEVEIDESLLFKRKSHVGRIGHQTWVVGCYDTTVKKGFLQRVPDRSAATLEAVIIENVLPGTIVHTDK